MTELGAGVVNAQIYRAGDDKQPFLGDLALRKFVRAFYNSNDGNAGGVIGSGSAAKFKIANTVAFFINGALKSKTTAEVVLTGEVQAINTKRRYLISVAADGTPSCVQGPSYASTVDDADVQNGPVPDDESPFGDVLVETDETGTFIPGTTLLSASQITDTFSSYKWVVNGPDAPTY